MPDRKLFHEDPQLDLVETQIVATGATGGKPWVRLEATVFYPGGGGQAADRGTISDVPVLDVLSRGEEILHVLERPLPEGPAVARIDAPLRFERSQQHTAQHLLTAILLSRHGLPTTAFHLGEEYAAIEIAGEVPGRERLAGFEDEVNAEIRLDRRVGARWVTREEYESLPVRSRGLPEGHRGDIRLVEIEGLDLNTCGGTHVRRLAEIQMVRLLDAAPARGGARIRFLAGERVLRELRRGAEIEEGLKARLGTRREEFASVLDVREEGHRLLERGLRRLEGEIAEREALSMAAEAGPLLARRIDGAGPERLRAIASAVLKARPEAVVALVGRAGEPPETCFLVQSGASGPSDVAELAARLRGALGAKGGGRGRSFQGCGGTWPDDLEAIR